jgi:hypothetical protein
MAVILPNVGNSAQGTALDPTGAKLVVADYSQGHGVTGLTTFVRRLLPGKDGKPLRGIDGLARCGDRYCAVYNGNAPGRLLTFKLGEAGIEHREAVPGLALPDPTQVAFDGRRLLLVADAGWEQAGRPGLARAAGAPILAIPLTGNCEAR